MIKAVTISIILALAVYLSPQVLARHKTPPAPATNVSSTNTNNNLNVNKNVNKNENKIDIDIENSQTQTQNVTLGARVAAVPTTLPATGPSSLALSLMAGAIPLGLYLRKYQITANL
ncbi:hypothetical protein A3F45_00710 [Candidatus Curtissbacteria bacterium RIFCSPHIGHO2_12_FULL_41_17]|uniref:Gram-positive cocci surface proteins LPxTG domain-containing protein n=2 Tax=Candidatus Curtissiibacteriota TaxID=1752717 RepID=A0A1F5HKL7_9BACT|nr:MAG: hypothetical protein A2693_04330 [Candidatus Curtissbacteria bacterium RIFCSPHIGHO2_01_FULL_40_12]OGE04691.1 MAG: hypothetical protein A3F45_00710 [Candidatus Curtissbacteria bacterium RIFCSPHIGHO2_12_FULL_41_17]